MVRTNALCSPTTLICGTETNLSDAHATSSASQPLPYEHLLSLGVFRRELPRQPAVFFLLRGAEGRGGQQVAPEGRARGAEAFGVLGESPKGGTPALPVYS